MVWPCFPGWATLPEALDNLADWWIAAAFAVGGGAYVGADSLIKRMKPSGDLSSDRPEEQSGADRGLKEEMIDAT